MAGVNHAVAAVASDAAGNAEKEEYTTIQNGAWSRYDRPSLAARRIILALFFLLVALPVIGMLYFSFRSTDGGMTTSHWAELFSSAAPRALRMLNRGLGNSLAIVLVTIAIEYVVVIPTLVLLDVRFPRSRRWMRVLMLLPIAIPAIILVVGYAPVFSFIYQWISTSQWTLAFAYGIISLPFVYTTIEADLMGMNAATLTQAAESLGAGWLRTLWSVLLPGLRKSIVSCTLITAAISLGEFTIASLLNRETLQTDLIVISQSDVYLSVVVTLIILILTFVALFLVSGAGAQRRPGHGTGGRKRIPQGQEAAEVAEAAGSADVSDESRHA